MANFSCHAALSGRRNLTAENAMERAGAGAGALDHAGFQLVRQLYKLALSPRKTYTLAGWLLLSLCCCCCYCCCWRWGCVISSEAKAKTSTTPTRPVRVANAGIKCDLTKRKRDNTEIKFSPNCFAPLQMQLLLLLLWRLRLLIGMETPCPIEQRLIPIYGIVKCKRTS